MLGPLPLLHRMVVVAAVLAVFVGLGLWMGLESSAPVVLLSGTTFGVLSGGLVSWLVVHDSHERGGPHLGGPRS